MDTAKETPKEEVNTKEEVKLDLPRVENTTFVYDSKKKMFWIGMPVEKTEPMIAMCVLDSMKMQYLQAFSAMIEAEKHKIQIQSPGVLNNIRNNFVSKFKK